MDKAKGVLKGGWHPAGDPKIHRDSWKSDLKSVATGKSADKKHLEESRNHQSVPLASLKDPDSFGPPPKHADTFGSGSGTLTSPARAQPPPPGGLGGPVPAPRWKQQQQAAEEKPKPPPVPYRTDTTGLNTANLPKPPARRVDNELAPPPPPPARHAAPAPAVQHVRAQATAPTQSRPAPIPPPRMNDHPDEFTPPAPPPYNEATPPVPQPAARDPAVLNQGALNRLSQAGVSVPGFNIGNNANANANTNTNAPQSAGVQGHAGQLSELQQRFARMNTGAAGQASQPPISSTAAASVVSAAVAAHKKPPPPPPPKRGGLTDGSGSRPTTQDGETAPPPLPLASKPRPP